MQDSGEYLIWSAFQQYLTTKSKGQIISKRMALQNYIFLTSRSRQQRCSVKKVFLEISQNSQENTCVRVSFLIKCRPKACNFIKKDTLAQVFSFRFCEISKNTFFYRTPWKRNKLLKWSKKLFLSIERAVKCQKLSQTWKCILKNGDICESSSVSIQILVLDFHECPSLLNKSYLLPSCSRGKTSIFYMYLTKEHQRAGGKLANVGQSKIGSFFKY